MSGSIPTLEPDDAQRAGLESIIADLRAAMRHAGPAALAEALVWAADSHDALSRGACDSALNTVLFRSEDERSEYDWLADQYLRLGALARQVAEKLVDDHHLDRAQRASVLAYALLLSGHAAKWRQISGRGHGAQPAGPYHALLKRALDAGLSDLICSVQVDGVPLETSVESLYARALLLDRLASGNLSARQVEILDNWLAAWMPSLMVSYRDLDGEPCLATDLDDTRGLFLPDHLPDRSQAAPKGRPVYLPIAPLQRQLDRAVEYFHQGLIFPGFGLGMTFRIEEHLGVIDYLSREFALLRGRAQQKRPRYPVRAGTDVDVYFGMNDVVTRAIHLGAAERVALLAEGARDRLRDARPGAFVETAEFVAFDPARKLLPVLDVSESGLGLSVAEGDAQHIHVGDLAAIRLDVTVPVLLGVVSRKALLPGGTRMVVGINFISKRAQPVVLEFPPDGGSARPPASAIFVPGEDDSGRGDSILSSETVYRTDQRYRVKQGKRVFEITLSRVKSQGRGWKLAAFDVLSAADA